MFQLTIQMQPHNSVRTANTYSLSMHVLKLGDAQIRKIKALFCLNGIKTMNVILRSPKGLTIKSKISFFEI
jgi:hypothetical protein